MLVHRAACGLRAAKLVIWRAARCPAAARAGAARAASTSSSRPAAAAATASAAPAVGDELELRCSDLAFGGEGVCRLPGTGMVLFVAGALPGERLTARVTQLKKSFGKGVKTSTLEPHADAVQPECEHFGPCGGCSLQALTYEAQLAAKQRQVADLLRRTGGVPDAELAAALRPPLGCPPGHGGRLAYRNTMEFSWGPAAGGQPGAGSSSGSSSQASSSSSSSSSSSGGANGSSGGGASSSGFALGLHLPGSDTQVLPISHCRLQPDPANALLARVRELAAAAGLQPYDPATGVGLLQHAVIRRARGSGGASSSKTDGSSAGSSGSAGAGEEYLLNLVTAEDGRQALALLAAALMRDPLACLQPGPAGAAAAAAVEVAAEGAAQSTPPPRLVGVVNSVSARGRPAGERRLEGEHVLAGRGHLVERLRGLEFEVSANSFFQTNTPQAEVLYRLVAEGAELRPGDTVLDLYCGTGSIGLTLAASCARVVGVEISPAAVADANRNGVRNRITNASFIQGDLSKLRLEGRLPAPDVVVVDPARPGLSPSVISYLRACGARRLVYVSCNASTQARDIKQLCTPVGASAGTSGGTSSGGNGKRSSGGKRGGGGARGGSSSGGEAEQQFRLRWVQAVDLYPQTWHVETVAVLDAVQ